MDEDLDVLAENFSNFEDFEDYTGEGDAFVDFNGLGQNWFDPHNNTYRSFSIVIGIATTFVKSGIQLFGDVYIGAQNSSYSDLAASSLDTGLTVSASPKGIKHLYAWLQNQPTILKGFQIVSSNTNVLAGIITTYQTSPFRELATDPINLSAYKNEYQEQQTILTVKDYEKVVGNQNYWLIPMVATGSAYTVTINLYFGAALNTSQALEGKQFKAAKTIAKLGGAKVVNAMKASG